MLKNGIVRSQSRMSAGRFEVEGRVFYNKTDYEAALRDYDKIKEIKKEFDLSNAEDVRQVYALLAGGSYRFESIIGDDFDDEIYKLFSEIKNAPLTDAPVKKVPKVKKQKSGKEKLSFVCITG